MGIRDWIARNKVWSVIIIVVLILLLWPILSTFFAISISILVPILIVMGVIGIGIITLIGGGKKKKIIPEKYLDDVIAEYKDVIDTEPRKNSKNYKDIRLFIKTIDPHLDISNIEAAIEVVNNNIQLLSNRYVQAIDDGNRYEEDRLFYLIDMEKIKLKWLKVLLKEKKKN